MPKRLLLFFAFLLSANLVFAQTYKQDVSAIKSSRLSSNKAIAKHDIDGISKYWLPDFVQTIGRGVSTTGKDSVIAGWKELFKTNQTVIYVRTPTSILVGVNGIMAWETGTWAAKNSYSKGGRYSAMWRKINDRWMLQAELFVSLRKL